MGWGVVFRVRGFGFRVWGLGFMGLGVPLTQAESSIAQNNEHNKNKKRKKKR